jgi:hypothetical protein
VALAEACVATELATFSPCATDAAGFVALLLAVAGTDCPTGLAAAAASGAATVAVNTLAVMFGDPAELGVEGGGTFFAASGGAAALAGFALFACSPTEGTGVGVTTGALAVAEAGVWVAEPTVTLMDDGTLLFCGAFEVGTVFTANSGLGFGALFSATAVAV